jgi:hypothetical protein
MACTRLGCGRRCNGFHEYVVPAMPALAACTCAQYNPWFSITPPPCQVHNPLGGVVRTTTGTNTIPSPRLVTS